ncbi:hypothetical protein GCM10009853_023880 [Glycomyces scopariae]
MRKGLFRRTIRRARTARRTGAPTVSDAAGKRYRVVPVDDPETAKYADPPRKWPRVGAMAAVWAVVLGLGAWIAPAFAASGSEQNEDSRDQAAIDATGAALRYIENSTKSNFERADAALCEDSSPALTPEALEAISMSFSEELGNITRYDFSADDPVQGAEGISVPVTVTYLFLGAQRYGDFLVTVQEGEGVFCVSDTIRTGGDEPSDSETGTTEADVDTEALAAEFLTNIVANRRPDDAKALQCENYEGVTAQELDTAVQAWTSQYGETIAAVSVDPADSEDSIEMFDAKVILDGDTSRDTYEFKIGVQGDCIASLDGGDELLNGAD